MKGDRLEEAIDAVVRDIMRTEPPAGLRARVMGQLSTPQRRVWLTAPRLAAAAVFAVCVVAGLVVTRERSLAPIQSARTVAVVPEVARATATLAARPPQPQPGPDPAVGRSPGARRLTATPPDDERVVSAMSIDEPPLAVAIAPLQTMPAITAVPIASFPVQVEETALRPLAIEPVRIDPLPSPPR
jgi:hypothetical protein